MFIIAGMIGDKVRHGKVHRAYWIGLGACVTTELVTIFLPHTAFGSIVQQALGAIGSHLAFFYG